MDVAVVLLAVNAAFAIVFGVFVAALLVLVVITITWAVRRDRPGRAAWRQRRRQSMQGPGPHPASNGHRPVASDRPPADPA